MLDELVEIKAIKDDDYEEPEFDFSSPENVLIHVIEENGKRYIEIAHIIWWANPGVLGAASYEEQFGGFLRYTIEGIIDMPPEGWYVVENIAGYYSRGEWGFTEDEMEFYYDSVRPATEEEINEVMGELE